MPNAQLDPGNVTRLRRSARDGEPAALGVTERTVQRDWVKAWAWLSHYFLPDPTP